MLRKEETNVMAKNKKKKHKAAKEEQPLRLCRERFDEELDTRYGEIYDEIQEMNRDLYRADQKEILRMRKTAEKGGFITDERLKARVAIIKRQYERGWFKKVTDLIVDLIDHSDVIKLFVRVVVSFLVSLLSLDSVKKYISPGVLDCVDKIYAVAVKFA